MEEDFPRGAVIRRATRSTDEKKKCFVQLGVKRSLEDVLFKDSEQATPSKGKKKKKTKKSEGEETEEPDLEEEFEGATETEGFIPKTLTSKTLSEGMLVLAVVQEIHEYEIVLSLPNGQTAFVQITDVSSFFTQQLQELNESNGAEDQDLPNIQDVYQVGNLVPCKVKSLGASKDGHRRIQASLDYKEVNSELGISFIKAGMTLHGCVSSVEDHGYTIDLGIRGTNAFLAKEEATKGAKGRKGETMKTGKLVTCLVKAVKANGRSIILTFDPERLKSCKATKATHTTFSSLIPGTRLDAMVTKVLSNSLIMDIFGLYKGCVDPIHLKDTVDELTKYDIGQKLVAVVLYNCPTTKSIGLSLNPAHHKTTFDPATDVIRDLSPGDIIEAALVVRVQEKENLIVQLNPKTRGIVYHSHGSDDKQKRYSPASVGEKVRCRILSFNLFDRLAIVSMRKSILDKPFLGINDVKPGMLVKGVIESVMSRGVAVKIQDRIHGFVPRTHLADIPVQKPQERFTIGSEIELRVLLVEPAKRRVLLTHKKTMVKSSLPFLASYAQPKLGMWIHGCVVAVKDFGCIVSFYNDVKGIIPRAELGMDESSSPTDNFYVGQVLKCRVLRTHSPESKKLALSLRKDGRKERESFEAGKESEPSTSRMMDSIASEGSSESEFEDESEEKLEDGYHEDADQDELEEMQMELEKERERAEKREKTLVLEKDTSPSNEFFQEIAESLKAFSSIMVDVKLMRLEMKTMKGMLQELTGKKKKMVMERRRVKVKDDGSARDGGQMADMEESEEQKRRVLDENDLGDRDIEGRNERESVDCSVDNNREGGAKGYAEMDEFQKLDTMQNVEVRRPGRGIISKFERRSVEQDPGREVRKRIVKSKESLRKDVTEKKWEPLSEQMISELHGRARNRAVFSTCLIRKLISDDVLINSNCYGKVRSNSRRPNVEPINPDILMYVLEKTYDQYGVEESDKKACHRECIDCIDSHCRGVFKRHMAGESKSRTDRMKPYVGTGLEQEWKPLSEEMISELRDCSRNRATFSSYVIRELISDDVLINSNCYGRVVINSRRPNVKPIHPGILKYTLEKTYDQYGVEESDKKACHRECIECIDSYCRGVLSRKIIKESKSTTGRKEGNEGTGLESERTGSPRNNDSGVGKVANGKGRSVKSWLSKAEITIIRRKVFLNSTAKFARNLLKKLVSDDILMHSNCYNRYRSDYPRRKITPIDPDIVKYVLETTYGIFDVDVLMKKDCHRECVECMDAYCRRLHAKVRTRRSKNEADKNESPEKGKNFRDGDTSFKKDEDGTRVESDVRKGGAAEEKLPWEKLSEKEIADEWSDAAGWSWGTFARTILTKLVGNDVLAVSSCFVRFPQATGKRPVLPINPIILHDVLELTYDTFGIDESNKKGCDEECIRLINAQCRNQFEQRRKRVEKGGGARLPWERLSDYEISSIATRARTSEYFAKCLMTKLVSDDILINSSCSGVRSWEDYICSRPPVQRIDQGILNYALEKTIDVFAINELEKEKCIQECFISIDAYCRDLFRKSIKVKSGNGADGEGINEGKDIHETRHDRCTPERSRDSLDSVIVETDSDDEHGWYSPGEVNDIMEHDPMSDGSDVERVEVANVGGERTLESDDDSGDKCVGYNPNESEGRMANDPPRGENNDERDYVVVKVEEKLMETDSGLINEDKTGDEVGVHGTKRQYWEPLSEDSIIKIRAKAKTRGQFAEFVLTNMLDDGILKKSTWSWSSTALGKRSHAQPIDPDILRYILNTTYDMYGVEESDKENCFRECVKHVDAYCRLLSDMSEPKIERKQGETDENESTVEKKKRGIAGPENPLSQKEIWILHDKSSNWSCFARRLLSKFISNDILMNSNCAGKSGAMRSNVQAIDPNILRYVLDTTYRTYHVAEVERNICKSQCTTYIDNYCRQLHRKTRAMPGKRQNNADDGWVEDIYGR
ncbi:uncharacterized protein LOC115923994 isoform X2 [Strongylocentrotus purpuratus]|uniref:Uncharacterized protein n=1 Tax=Strongylocentrotus purpuratus TaxID=7668 RepID=A0A7M7NTP9_STRPU|nr:uncharacterized protein LOC115923994 isoform X2 [Strongylocentrotus purpuratus]